jgi:LacI family transcriptional regulator
MKPSSRAAQHLGEASETNVVVKLVDVARAAGTSVATVSRVVNNNDRVDVELARRVKTAAKKLGYQPNATARNLRRRRTNMWLLIISDIENAFFTSVARGVADVAAQNGFSVVLCNTDEDADKETRYIELATEEQVAGVILSPHGRRTTIDRLIGRSIPVVVIDRSIAAEADSVRGDYRGGACVATEHLLQQGWHRPACVTGPRSNETAELRRLGYLDALAAAGIATRRVSTQPYTIDGGRAGAARLLSRPSPPDAFVVENTALTVGVLAELRERGLRAGEDVGLVCFEDSPWAPLIDPPLTVVIQPGYQIGLRAAMLLSERISSFSAGPPRNVLLDTDMIVRRSSRRGHLSAWPSQSFGPYHTPDPKPA